MVDGPGVADVGMTGVMAVDDGSRGVATGSVQCQTARADPTTSAPAVPIRSRDRRTPDAREARSRLPTPLRMIWLSVSPWMYSMTMEGCPSCVPVSKIVTMLGWRSALTVLASRLNRSRSSLVSNPSRNSLIATRRSISGSRPR